MREGIARQIRGAQVRAPWLFGIKNRLQREIRRRRRKPFDADFAALAKLGLRPDGLVLDIGGNRGQSIDAVRLFMPRARIVSFEPNVDLAADLRRLFAADDCVIVHNVALGDAPGELTLHIPYYNGWMFDGLASLDRKEAAEWLSRENLAGFRSDRVEIRTMTTNVTTLDSLDLGDPVFVKIDVQGFEPNVLDGGAETMKRARPVVMLETRHDIDMLAHLPSNYEPAHWTGERLQSGQRRTVNTFYLPGEIARRL